MTAPAGVPVCECEHPQTQHKGLKDGCRRCDLGCARYTEDKEATARAQAEYVGAPAPEVPTAEERESARKLMATITKKTSEVLDPVVLGDAFVQESTLAKLRRVEQERDDARHDAAEARAQAAGVGAELASARTELDALRAELERERQSRSDFEAVAVREVETLRERGLEAEGVAMAELNKLHDRIDALVAEAQRLREENRRLDNERDQLVAEALDNSVAAAEVAEPIAEFTITITRRNPA